MITARINILIAFISIHLYFDQTVFKGDDSVT